MGMPGTNLAVCDLVGGSRGAPVFGRFTPRDGPRGGREDNAPIDWSDQHPEVLLYVEDEFDEFVPVSNATWATVNRQRDGADTTCTITGMLDAEQLTDAGSIGNDHFQHAVARFQSNRRVLVKQIEAGLAAPFLFRGWPGEVTLHLDQQRFTVLCGCEGQALLRDSALAQIYHVNMIFDSLAEPESPLPASAWRSVEAVEPVFNPHGRGNRSAGTYDLELQTPDGPQIVPVHLFADPHDDDAERWTTVQALRYLLMFHLGWFGAAASVLSVAEFFEDTQLENLHLLGPNQSGTNPFVRYMTTQPESLSVQSLNLDEALKLLCSLAGLHYEVDLVSDGDAVDPQPKHVLRVWANRQVGEDYGGYDVMAAPQEVDLALDPPFTAVGDRTPHEVAEQNRVQQGAVSLDDRAKTHSVVLGGRREYEMTLLLRPGWLPHTYLDNLSTASDEVKTTARNWWISQFAAPFVGVSRVRDTPYHTCHPDHDLLLDPETHGAINTDHHSPYSEVGRTWVFPDTWRYLLTSGTEPTSDWARTTGTWSAAWYSPVGSANRLVYFSSTKGGGCFVMSQDTPRSRPFLAPIAATEGAQNSEIVVRFYWGALNIVSGWEDAAGWSEYKGKPIFDARRAALSLTDADLWRSPLLIRQSRRMLEHLIDGEFYVSVTCRVVADARMFTQNNPTAARPRWQVVDYGFDRFKLRDRSSQNSHLRHQLNTLGLWIDEDNDNRDDQSALDAEGARLAYFAGAQAVAGSPMTPWIDRTVRLGDAVTGIAGLGISFETHYPDVAAITYTNHQAGDSGEGPGRGIQYSTTLALTDTRDNPAIGEVDQ